jgi:hypothetical protein
VKAFRGIGFGEGEVRRAPTRSRARLSWGFEGAFTQVGGACRPSRGDLPVSPGLRSAIVDVVRFVFNSEAACASFPYSR